MSKKLATDEPPEGKFSLKSYIKNCCNKFLSNSCILRFKCNKSKINEVEQNLIIKNFESFAEKVAEDVMIPRADIISVKYDISLEDLSKIIIKSGHTRILVYKENLDNIIGFVHIKDLFELIAKSKKYNLKKLIRKHIVSPHAMKLVDLLKQMQNQRIHIAVVVDEYGGTDGIVTIEDIIEEIVGRIDDEHDTELNMGEYKVLKPGLILANARMEVEELEKILSVSLRQENAGFETIGGLVLAKVGNVPDKGDVIKITDEVTIEIINSTPRAIKQLKVICSKD